MDVFVQRGLAYVATGPNGLAVVDLLTDPPTLVTTIDVPGFAAAVAVEGNRAYVAACDTLAVIDVSRREVLSTAWLNDPYEGDILVAPAKDVVVLGDVAYVAAGRFGVVAIDVHDSERPTILGNHTDLHDHAFYVSGVSVADDTVFVRITGAGAPAIDYTLELTSP